MSPVLPFELISLIIDIVGETKDTNLLKELALVSHCFLEICRKHIFATVELHDAVPRHRVASSKKGFVKLFKSRPDFTNYIRELKYEASLFDDDDHLLSPILLSFLPTISRLNCLTIDAFGLDWNTLDSSLTSALLYLMHLPTINHIDLSYIENFPLSSLASSVNLLRLDILDLCHSNPRDEDPSEIVVQSETMPKIREFHTSESSLLTTTLLHAKRQDGLPVFNFMDLRRLSIYFFNFEDGQNIRYLLQHAKLLHLSVEAGRDLVGVLSPIACTLKFLELKVFLHPHRVPPLLGLCEELEAMVGHNMLETLSFEVIVNYHLTEELLGSIIQKVENVLVKPGWFALRQVSFKLILPRLGNSAELSEALQSLPDKYLRHLSTLESVAFNYSVSI